MTTMPATTRRISSCSLPRATAARSRHEHRFHDQLADRRRTSFKSLTSPSFRTSATYAGIRPSRLRPGQRLYGAEEHRFGRLYLRQIPSIARPMKSWPISFRPSRTRAADAPRCSTMPSPSRRSPGRRTCPGHHRRSRHQGCRNQVETLAKHIKTFNSYPAGRGFGSSSSLNAGMAMPSSDRLLQVPRIWCSSILSPGPSCGSTAIICRWAART